MSDNKRVAELATKALFLGFGASLQEKKVMQSSLKVMQNLSAKVDPSKQIEQNTALYLALSWSFVFSRLYKDTWITRLNAWLSRFRVESYIKTELKKNHSEERTHALKFAELMTSNIEKSPWLFFLYAMEHGPNKEIKDHYMKCLPQRVREALCEIQEQKEA